MISIGTRRKAIVTPKYPKTTGVLFTHGHDKVEAEEGDPLGQHLGLGVVVPEPERQF